MPTHWTYEDFDPNSDLAQGDILVRTEGLDSLTDSIHSHFSDKKYLGFIVLTQSCDLVQRQGRCGAKYITLAVFRSLDELLPSFFEHLGTPRIAQVFPEEAKDRLKQLLTRIFNQNEQSMGLFYLHDDLDSGISVPSVALLRVAIAYKSQHYDNLKAARRGRLRPAFSSKLGWLTGNLFGRVATPDWDYLTAIFASRRSIPV